MRKRERSGVMLVMWGAQVCNVAIVIVWGPNCDLGKLTARIYHSIISFSLYKHLIWHSDPAKWKDIVSSDLSYPLFVQSVSSWQLCLWSLFGHKNKNAAQQTCYDSTFLFTRGNVFCYTQHRGGWQAVISVSEWKCFSLFVPKVITSPTSRHQMEKIYKFCHTNTATFWLIFVLVSKLKSLILQTFRNCFL